MVTRKARVYRLIRRQKGLAKMADFAWINLEMCCPVLGNRMWLFEFKCALLEVV